MINFKKGKQPQPVSRLAELLGTADAAAQAQRVEQLLQAVAQPTITMTIQLDQRTGVLAVGVLGAELSYGSAHNLLALAADELRRRERAELDARAAQNQIPPPPAP